MTKAAELANLIGNINAGGGGVNRNLIINGAMNVSQRHGTTSVQLSATEQYLTDRFFNDAGSSFDMKADAVQSTDTPSGFANSLKLSCDGVSSLTSSANGGITQHIEGQNCQALAFGTSDAKPVTLSFYAKSSSQNNGHTYGIMFGAFLNGTRNIQTRGFTVTSSWQRFTMTFEPNSLVTSTGINDDNDKGIQVFFSLAGGSSDLKNYSVWTNDQALSGFTGQDNFFDNTSNEFFLTGVQLEIGQNATTFEHEPTERTLLKCHRYYRRWGKQSGDKPAIAAGMAYDVTSVYFPLTLDVPMRSQPTVDYSNLPRAYKNNTAARLTSISINTAESDEHSVRLEGQKSNYFTAEAATWLQVDTPGEWFALDAEL
jgi:hypothetical protein